MANYSQFDPSPNVEDRREEFTPFQHLLGMISGEWPVARNPKGLEPGEWDLWDLEDQPGRNSQLAEGLGATDLQIQIMQADAARREKQLAEALRRKGAKK